jgi:uncharacterized SAM-binding protein YcdF (DUF218 family)
VIRRAATLAARALGAPLAVRDAAAVADAIVVLGAPLTPDGALSAVLAERVAAGHALWRAGAAPLVCVTGGPSRGGRTEGDAMAEALEDAGVPARALRVERAARTTADNARLVAALLAPDEVRAVWLVTQPFHLRRARWLFRRAGLDAYGHHIAGGLQDQDPARALRWITREYAAWALAVATRPRR